MSSRPSDDEDRSLLAGEYVLGLPPADEAAAVEAQLAQDEALAAAVGRWTRHLFGLTQLPAPRRPDAALWSRIERSLDAASATAARGRGTWLGSLAFWRLTSAGALLAALLLALRLLLPIALPDAGLPLSVAVLNNPDGKPGWIVQAYRDRSLRVRPLAETVTPLEDGRALQFWTKRNNEEGPVSLGLIALEGADHVSLRTLPLPVDGQLFEITLEPAGGSTVGHPTGPVLFKGYAARMS